MNASQIIEALLHEGLPSQEEWEEYTSEGLCLMNAGQIIATLLEGPGKSAEAVIRQAAKNGASQAMLVRAAMACARAVVDKLPKRHQAEALAYLESCEGGSWPGGRSREPGSEAAWAVIHAGQSAVRFERLDPEDYRDGVVQQACWAAEDAFRANSNINFEALVCQAWADMLP